MIDSLPRRMKIDGRIVTAWRSAVAIRDPSMKVGPGQWVIDYLDGTAKVFDHEEFCARFGTFARAAGFPDDTVKGLGFGTPDDPRNY